MPNTTNMRLIFPQLHDYRNFPLEMSRSDPIGLHKVCEYNPDHVRTTIVSPNIFLYFRYCRAIHVTSL